MDMKALKAKSKEDRHKMLAVMAKTYHTMGERTTRALAQRFGASEDAAQRILGNLSEYDCVYSAYRIYDKSGGWELTERGWAESGQKIPEWLE